MMVTQSARPATIYSRKMANPPKTNQIIFPKNFMLLILGKNRDLFFEDFIFSVKMVD